jgi:NCAIR mutase (PurE)-related protein
VTRDQLQRLLADVAAGRLEPAAALDRLRHFPTEQLPFAQLDHHRSLRQGHPEVIYCEGKTTEQVVAIAERLVAASGSFLGTRATENQAAALRARFDRLQWNPLGRTVFLPAADSLQPSADSLQPTDERSKLLVVSAGTSDLPVAEEAAVTAEAFGLCVDRLTDVGVAGLHRLLSASERLAAAAAIIVVAGMEGALPSVVGGLVSVPVIAVPTSVGYGASFGGLAALLAMLNSCAAGVTVVNIDNGFGAAVAASRILAGTGSHKP